MRITRTATVIATGVLTVSVSAPAKAYNGIAMSMTASWNTGAVGPFQGQITWGDGTAAEAISQSSKSITKTHTYTANGTFTITVAVSDSGTLASGAGTASIQIGAQLAASFSASPTSGTIPLAVTFNSGISGGYSPYTWSIDPGDGSAPYSGTYPGAPFNQVHTYTKVGTYTATLTATDALGASLSVTVPVGVAGEIDYAPLIWLGLAGIVLYIFRKELKIKI